MKIYFCGSISGGRQDGHIYADHIKKLKKYGEVLTEHVGNTEQNEASLNKCYGGKDHYIHDRDVEWLQECDVVVAEVTQPSLGVGYELGRAVALKKPILGLFRPQDTDKMLSCLIRGMDESLATVVDYKVEDVDRIFQDFFAGIESRSKNM